MQHDRFVLALVLLFLLASAFAGTIIIARLRAKERRRFRRGRYEGERPWYAKL